MFTSAQQQFQFFPVHNRHQLTPQTGTLWSQVQLDLLEVLDPQELAVQVVQEAEEAVNEYRKRAFRGPVYLMPCGGVERVYNLNNRNVAELAMRKGWRYSDRLQVPLFKNEWGT